MGEDKKKKKSGDEEEEELKGPEPIQKSDGTLGENNGRRQKKETKV